MWLVPSLRVVLDWTSLFWLLFLACRSLQLPGATGPQHALVIHDLHITRELLDRLMSQNQCCCEVAHRSVLELADLPAFASRSNSVAGIDGCKRDHSKWPCSHQPRQNYICRMTCRESTNLKAVDSFSLRLNAKASPTVLTASWLHQCHIVSGRHIPLNVRMKSSPSKGAALFFPLKDEADTPLHLACCYQQLPTIELLLEVDLK